MNYLTILINPSVSVRVLKLKKERNNGKFRFRQQCFIGKGFKVSVTKFQVYQCQISLKSGEQIVSLSSNLKVPDIKSKFFLRSKQDILNSGSQ
ncbi:MAG: hypothetical protein H6Q23_894 [Bacteroidetes bacterium]|nr:hypothetical protein [Bacteroidota bacterium]